MPLVSLGLVLELVDPETNPMMSGAHVKRLAALKPFTGGSSLYSGHGWPASGACPSEEGPMGGSSSSSSGATVPSLTDLCYERLLCPAHLSVFEEEVLCGGALLPPTFFSDAVRLSLCQNRTWLLRLLLKHWPEPLLSLRAILPAPLGCDMQWPLQLIRVFLDGLAHVPRTLNTLDLRGFEIHDHDFLKNYKDLLCDPMSAQIPGKMGPGSDAMGLALGFNAAFSLRLLSDVSTSANPFGYSHQVRQRLQ